ncbi:MAG: hypothetical protein QG602_2325, partial [Verrucomicrobiota bacterium]|nr:hypothetical protein [Verrucomicrobiota bacterium]
PREAIAAEAKRLAIEYGGQAALAASSIGQEVGSIYGDNPDAPVEAIAYGIPAGLLDVLPESYIASRFLGAGKRVAEQEVKQAAGYFRRFATEAAKVVPMEGSTEAAQTLLEIAAAKSARGESPTSFTDDDYRQMLNAGIIGAIGGLGMAPVSAYANPAGATDPTGRIDETVVNRLPIGNAPEPAGPMEFGGEIPEQDLISRETLDRGTQQAIAAEERVGFEGFNRGEEMPYELGSGQPAGAPTAQQNLAPAVAKAVEAVDEKIGEWNEQQNLDQLLPGDTFSARSFPEFGEPSPAPPSADITDAPLANFVGTRVGYQGYVGQLVRDQEGNFMVMPEVREGAKPFWIEVEGSGKNPATMATVVGIEPLEPPNMTPKPAPGVAVPSTPGPGANQSGISKVPLGDLFPSDLVPRQDITVNIPNVPPVPVRPASPSPGAVASPAPTTPPLAVQTVMAADSGGTPSDAPGAAGAGKVIPDAPKGKDEAAQEKFSRRQIAEQRRLVKELERKAEQAGVAGNARKTREFTQRANAERDKLTQMQADKLTKMAPKIGYGPDGAPDLLSDIAEHVGKISTQGTGGEYDGWVDATSFGAAKMLRGGSKGMAPDLALEIINGLGPYKFDSMSAFQDAVDRAARNRTKLRERMAAEEGASKQEERFRKVAIDNKGRGEAKAGKPVAVDELTTGSTFKIAREKFEVIDITEDGDVIVRDGERFGDQKLKPGEVLYPDKGTLRLVRIEDVEFIPGEGEQSAPQSDDPFADNFVPEDQLPKIAPTGKVTLPTGEQAASGNGVWPLPADSVPNLRRLRIFEVQRETPQADEEGPVPAPRGVEAQSINENPLVVLDKAVGKLGKQESNVAVVVADAATGQAYMRGAYRGAGNTLYVDLASSRKGTAVGKGSTVTAEADFLNGTEGRPATKLFAEKLPDGSPRYSIYGVAELT